MGKVITLNPREIRTDTRELRTGLIQPAEFMHERITVDDHAAEPIKSVEDIDRICQFLISNGRYRDNMLFVVGINFGLRVSDLRSLRFSDLIDESFTFRTSFSLIEKKTENTRKHKRNRYITINNAVIEAVTLYLENTPGVTLDDYLFRTDGNRGKNSGEPLHRNSIDKILKGIAKDCGLNIHMSTHTLRKTFAYHQMAMSGNDPRKLLLLQKMFGHSSSAMTLEYIGITGEEIADAYCSLNLGSSRGSYSSYSVLSEAV